MSALNDAEAEVFEGVAKLDKNHEQSSRMQESIETSADPTAYEMMGLDRKTTQQEVVSAETQPRPAKPPLSRERS